MWSILHCALPDGLLFPQCKGALTSCCATLALTVRAEAQADHLDGQRNAMAGLRNPDQLRPAMAYIRALPRPVRRRHTDSGL
jgi:hypothetical protein